MSTISIIMPVYTVEQYLAYAIDSVLNQSFTDFELICVNDGSTDSSADILESYAHKDSRITVIHKKNGGASSARNVALAHVSSPYIAFLDSDDAYHPLYLEKLYYPLHESDADFIWCDFNRCIETIEMKTLPYATQEIQAFSPIFEYALSEKKPRPTVMPPNKLYRTRLLQGITFDESLHVGEDVLFSYQVFYKAQKALYTPLPLYNYRKRKGSTSRSNFSYAFADGYITVAEKLVDYFHAIPMSEPLYSYFWHNVSKWMMRLPIAQPWIQTRPTCEVYWDTYRERILSLYTQKKFKPEYLDFRSKILAHALLSKQYWILKTILKVSYW